MRKQFLLTCLIAVGLITGTACASKKKQTRKDKRKAKQKAKQKKEKDRKARAAADKAASEKAAADAKTEQGKLKARIDRLESELERVRSLAESRKKLHDDLRNELDSLVDAGKVKITTRRGLLVVQIPREVLFKSGRSKLSTEGRKTLGSVASSLQGLKRNRVLVAGHTDNVPVSKKAMSFKDNWELSSHRALHATKVLAEAGVSQKKLAAAGFGEHDPIASNDSEESRKKNRRVELMLLPNLSQIIERSKERAQNAQD